jgi:hypothetical protein
VVTIVANLSPFIDNTPPARRADAISTVRPRNVFGMIVEIPAILA